MKEIFEVKLVRYFIYAAIFALVNYGVSELISTYCFLELYFTSE